MTLNLQYYGLNGRFRYLTLIRLRPDVLSGRSNLSIHLIAKNVSDVNKLRMGLIMIVITKSRMQINI